MTYIYMGIPTIAETFPSKHDQTFQQISWDVIHKNKAHTAKQLITLFSRGVESKPPGEGGSSKWIHLHSRLVEKMLCQKRSIWTSSKIVISLLIRTALCLF